MQFMGLIEGDVLLLRVFVEIILEVLFVLSQSAGSKWFDTHLGYLQSKIENETIFSNGDFPQESRPSSFIIMVCYFSINAYL